MMSLIEQLHTQLHTLNHNKQFHNDVKINNIVMRKITDLDKYELSLIDYGALTTDESNMGTFQSMCIRGCAQYLHREYPSFDERVRSLYISTSTDYVGFFHVVIFLLNPKMYNPFEIYREILDLKPEKENWYTAGNICKLLCLLCYVSRCSDKTYVDIVNAFLGKYTNTVDGIDKVLKSGCTSDNLQKFTSFIPEYVKDQNKYTEWRLLFLCFIYSKIINGYGEGYNPIIPIVEIPLFLWRLSCCFDFKFDLEQFNRDFNAIFGVLSLVPGQ
jgi:hypothetical protein